MDTKAYLSFIFLPSPSLTSTHTFEKKNLRLRSAPRVFHYRLILSAPSPSARGREKEGYKHFYISKFFSFSQTLIFWLFLFLFFFLLVSFIFFIHYFIHSFAPAYLHFFNTLFISPFVFFFIFSFLHYFISSEFISLRCPVRRSVGWSLVLFSYLNYQAFSHSIFPDFRVFTDVNCWHGSTPKLSRCTTSVCKCKCRL